MMASILWSITTICVQVSLTTYGMPTDPLDVLQEALFDEANAKVRWFINQYICIPDVSGQKLNVAFFIIYWRQISSSGLWYIMWKECTPSIHKQRVYIRVY